MNLLDRYIFKSALFTCLGAVGLLAFVLILGNAMRDLLGYAISGQIDALTLGRLLALLVPFVVCFALPMGMLAGVLLTLGRMSADSEITAMRAAGISLARVARPLIILALLGGALALYINLVAMPATRNRYKQELIEAVRANPLNFIVPRTFIRDFPGFVLYIGERQGTELHDFWFWQLDDQQRVVKQIHAANGSLDYEAATNSLILQLGEAQADIRSEKAPERFTSPPIVGTFGATDALRLSLDRLMPRTVARTKYDYMAISALEQVRDKLARPVEGETPDARAERERQHTKAGLAISDRYNNTLVVLTFALIGVPLGIKVSRRETSANLGVAVAIALSYYFLSTSVSWLDRRPDLHPELLSYLPNLIGLVLAGWLFWRSDRR